MSYVGKSAGVLGSTSVTRGINNTTAAAHPTGAFVGSALELIEGNRTNGIQIYKSKMTKKTFDIINFIIYNAGNDLESKGIVSYYFDSSSSFSKEKSTYKPWTDIAKKLKNLEEAIGNITQNADGTVTIDVSSGTTSWGVAYTNDTEYNDEFIIQANRLAAARSKKLVRNTGNVRWKGTITIRGKRIAPGILARWTSNSVGVQQQFLRVSKLQHNIDKSGWSTTISLEEDEQEQLVQV